MAEKTRATGSALHGSLNYCTYDAEDTGSLGVNLAVGGVFDSTVLMVEGYLHFNLTLTRIPATTITAYVRNVHPLNGIVGAAMLIGVFPGATPLDQTMYFGVNNRPAAGAATWGFGRFIAIRLTNPAPSVLTAVEINLECIG